MGCSQSKLSKASAATLSGLATRTTTISYVSEESSIDTESSASNGSVIMPDTLIMPLSKSCRLGSMMSSATLSVEDSA